MRTRTRRERVMHRIRRWGWRWTDSDWPDKLERRLPKRFEDWAYGPDYAIEWIVGKLCPLLRAHSPVNDQCGIPGHRYCANCNVSTPDAEVVKW